MTRTPRTIERTLDYRNLTPADISTIIGRPLEEVRQHLSDAEHRADLARALLANQSVRKAWQGDEEKLAAELATIQQVLEEKAGFLERMRRIGVSALLAPVRAAGWVVRNPVKSLIAAAVVLAGVGIVGGLGFAWVERLLQQVGLRKIEAAGDAARPLGSIGGGNLPDGSTDIGGDVGDAFK